MTVGFSTKIGLAKIFERVGGERLGRWLRRFHLGTAPAVADAAAGQLPARVEDRSFEGAALGIGEGRMGVSGDEARTTHYAHSDVDG